MRKQALAFALGLLFFGSIASSSFATVLQVNNPDIVVNHDGDKDKNKKKAKATEAKTEAKPATQSKSDCKTKKSSCCGSAMYEKSCKGEKGGGRK